MSFKISGESHADKIDIKIGDDDVAVRVICRKTIDNESLITVHRLFGFNGLLSKIPLAKFTNKTKKLTKYYDDK